jgi:hypothetical protein
MVVSINQPAYLPWLGYFERIASSDVHIVLDHVQFEKNSFTNRNLVPGVNGSLWLTVPVITKGKFGALGINDLKIRPDSPWAKKHWRTMSMIYRKAPFFGVHADFFEDTYQREWRLLGDLCCHITRYLLEQFEIGTEIRYSSEMGFNTSKSDLLLEICHAIEATKYISGAVGRDYLETSKFSTTGIEVSFQDYQHPIYTQVGCGEFQPNMAAIDLLFNHGPNSWNILTNADLLPDK